MRVLQLLHDRDIVQLDVEVLVHALQRAAHRDVVLELHRHLMIDESFEEAGSNDVPSAIRPLGMFHISIS